MARKKGMEKAGSSSSGPPGLPLSKKSKGKEGSSSSGPPDVPGDETDERKNKRCISVLVLGHAAAGKSMALRKINELENDRVKLEKATQHLNEVTMDESAQGRLLEHAMDNFEGELEGEEVTIRKIRYETTASIFHFFEAPSDYHYVSNMMSEAIRADLAVLFLSESNGEEDGIDDNEKEVQLKECFHLIRTLKINNVLIVVNKIDNPNEMQKSYKETHDCLTSQFVKPGTDLKCIPLSVKNGFNFQTITEESCTWWMGPCFIQALDEFEVEPARIIEAPTRTEERSSNQPHSIKESMLDLVITDLAIDILPSGKLWYQRALALSRLKKFVAVFEAARRAGEVCYFENPEKIFNLASFLTAGHYYRMRNDFDKAIEWFHKVKYFYEIIKNTEVLQLVDACLIQVWKEKEERESMTAKLKKPKGKISVVPEEGDVVRTENEDNEPDKTSAGTGTQAQESDVPTQVQEEELSSSDISSSQIITVSSVSYYEMSRVEDNLYEGIKIISSGVSIPLSFISGSPSQLKAFKELFSMGLENVSILTIMDKVDFDNDEVSSTFLVVQPVKTVEAFFRLELSKINDEISRSNDVISMWWNAIELKFRKIYRDVVDALVYLHSRNYPCGNLFDAKYNAIYLTGDGHVRLLPSLDTNFNFSHDIQDLAKHMRAMINLPCAGDKLVLSNLDDEISHLFTVMNPNKLKHVPNWFLLDHFFFWTSQERVNFIYDLFDWMKTDAKVKSKFDLCLENAMIKDDAAYWWPNQIPPGIFQEIWDKGDPKRQTVSTMSEIDLKNKGWFKVAPYEQHSDILRYMIAVYHHYNDFAYALFRSEKLDEVAIEGKLKQIFPKIYLQLVETIYELINWGVLTPKHLKRLSRHSSMIELTTDSSPGQCTSREI